jgi:hypothetical protein
MIKHTDALDDLNAALDREGSDPVLQPWVERIPWKQQSILFSGLRGPDHAYLPKIKLLSRWMRSVTQNNADPSKGYMEITSLPTPMDLDLELEHSPCHFVHHLADALAVIAYNHPDVGVSEYAAKLHYFIAEEIFHFQPELPGEFRLRHRDKRGGSDENMKILEWLRVERSCRNRYFESVMARFNLSA